MADLKIRFSLNGARVVQDEIRSVGDAAHTLRNALLGVAAAITGGKIIQVADEMQLLEARLKLVTASVLEFGNAQKVLYELSQKNAAGLAENYNMYVKLADPIKRMGGTVREVAGVVDSFGMAMRISGASTQEANAAITQFAQAMSSGKLQGDEFRSLSEVAPRLLKAIAQGSGIAAEDLKKMATAGMLTTELVGNALLKMNTTLQKEFSILPTTVGVALQRVENDFKVMVHAINMDSGVTAGIGGMIERFRTGLMPAIQGELIGAFRAVSGWISDNRQKLDEVGAAVLGLLSGVWDVAKGFASMAGAIASAALNSGAIDLMAQSLRVALGIVVPLVKVWGTWFLLTQAAPAMWAAYTGSVLAVNRALAGMTMQLQVLAWQAPMVAKAIGAIGIAAAGYVGWEIGSYLLREFEVVRLASVGLVKAVMMGWEYISYGAQAMWVGIKQVFFGSIDALINAWAGFVESIGQNMRNIPGLQGMAQAQFDYAAQLRATATNSTGLSEEQARLSAELASGVALVREITGEMAAAAAGTAQAGNAAQTADQQYAGLFKTLKTPASFTGLIDLFEKHKPKADKIKDELNLARQAHESARQFAQTITDPILRGEALAKADKMFKVTEAGILATGKTAKSAGNEVQKFIDKFQGAYLDAAREADPAWHKLTKTQQEFAKDVTKTDSAYRKMNQSQRDAVLVAVDNAGVQEKLNTTNEAAKKAREDYEKSILDQVKASQTALDTAREELENYGKTPAMIARVTLAKLRDREATLIRSDATELEMAAMREEIRLQEQLIGVLHQKQELEGRDKEAQAIAEANKKAAEDAAAEWKKTAEQISDGITDALMRGFESGKGFAKNFRDTVVNMFKTLVLQPELKLLIGGAFGLNGTAQAGQTGAGTLGSAAQSMGGLAGLANTFSLSGVGQALGLSTSAFATNATLAAQYATFSEVGIGAATSLTSAGTSLAGAASAISTAMPYLAAAAAVFSYFKSKEGGPKSGGFARQDFDPGGKAFDSAIPSRLFTPNQSDADVMKAVRDTGAGFTAQLKALGGKGGATFGLGFDTDPQGTAQNRISGEAFVNGQSVYSQRDREIGRDNNAIAGELALETQRMMLAAIKASELPAEVAKIISEGIPDAAKASAEEIQKVLGDATFWKAAFVDAPQQIAALFGQAVSLDQFKAVQQGGETLAQTFDRLQPVFAATNLAALVMGRDLATAFGAAGLASSAAREELARFAGGAQALQAGLESYYTDYFTEAERAAKTTETLTTQFGDLGMALPASREGFRKLVEAQDLTTESGRKTFAELMKLSPAFASVTKSAEDMAAAAKEQAEADKARFEDVAASIGLSFDSLKSNALASIAEPESAKLAGDMFADSVVGGIYTALQGQMAQQITDIITNSLVTPIVNSVIAGTSITEAVSKESIAEMVKSATKVAEAFGELFRSDDFKNLIATIRSGLAQIGSATYTASTYVPRPLALPTRDTATASTTSTPETVAAPELPSVADWIKEMTSALADMRAPNEYARQIGQINRQATEGAQRIADFLLPYEKLGKTTPEYAQAAEDAAEATRLLTQTTQAQIAAVREQQRQAVSEIVTGIADTITLSLMTPLDAAIARADIDAMKLFATLDKLGDASPESRAAVVLQRNLAVETAKFNAELEKLQARFADLQAVTGLIDSINDAIRTVLVDSKQMSEIDAINQQIGRAKQAVTDAVPNGPQPTVDAANELISLTMQRYNLEKAASEALTGNAKAQLDFAKQVRSYLKTLASSELSPFDFETRLRAAQTDFRDTLALAKSGDLTAQGRLQGVADNALKLTKDYYSISKPYGDFFGEVTAGLEGMTSSLETDAEKQTGLLTSLNDKARATLAELIHYRSVAEEYQGQVQAAFDGQTQAVIKQYAAIEALGLSMTNLNATLLALPLELRTAFTASATGTTPPRQTVGADLASIAGMAAGGNLAGALGVASGQYSAAQLADYWNSKNPQGERITAGNIEDFARANGIPGFAEGGIVGGPSLIMAGEAGAEAIVPLRGGAIPVTIDARNYGRSDDALVRELAAVRAELSEIKAQQAKIADAQMRQRSKIAEAELAQGEEQTKVMKALAAEITT